MEILAINGLETKLILINIKHYFKEYHHGTIRNEIGA